MPLPVAAIRGRTDHPPIGQPCSGSARQRRGDGIDVLLGNRPRLDQRADETWLDYQWSYYTRGPVQVGNPAHVLGKTYVRGRFGYQRLGSVHQRFAIMDV